jgi:YfiH family protein
MALANEQVASPHQVHGSHLERVDAQGAGKLFPATDGLVTDVPGVALLLRFADCQPILLYDPVHHALALVHAGWRGIALAIARRAVERMQAEFNSRPDDLVAGLGPAIGPCCYTVGSKVAAALGYVLPDWARAMKSDGDRWRLDITAANVQLLAASGVKQIEASDLCTACHTDEFYSHRAESGKTGRFGVVAYLADRPRPAQESELPLQADRPPDRLAQPQSPSPPGFPSFSESFGGEV